MYRAKWSQKTICNRGDVIQQTQLEKVKRWRMSWEIKMQTVLRRVETTKTTGEFSLGKTKQTDSISFLICR